MSICLAITASVGVERVVRIHAPSGENCAPAYEKSGLDVNFLTAPSVDTVHTSDLPYFISFRYVESAVNASSVPPAFQLSSGRPQSEVRELPHLPPVEPTNTSCGGNRSGSTRFAERERRAVALKIHPVELDALEALLVPLGELGLVHLLVFRQRRVADHCNPFAVDSRCRPRRRVRLDPHPRRLRDHHARRRRVQRQPFPSPWLATTDRP